MTASDWFLTAEERGNAFTVLDRRHRCGEAWTSGNEVRPLVHGASYFADLLATVRAMRAGDLLLFTDWRGDPDELLDGEGTEVSRVLAEAATAGVIVRGLVWRSHLDRLQFSERENRHLGEEIDAAGGVCLLDMRVRSGGSHHQKFVVLRHPGRPERDVAYVGGIDLCHSRHDNARHPGDPQAQSMSAIYGLRPPWHDIQVAIRGPAVGDVETVFRERWNDPAPLSRDRLRRLRDRLQGLDDRDRTLPEQLPDPAPCGPSVVQLLRTYPARRHGYPFAPDGERSVARAMAKVLARARQLIYLEDQYLWSPEVAAEFCGALRSQPELHLIAVIPQHPDQDGRISKPPNLIGRYQALRMLQEAGGDRVAVYGLENHEGTPVYVHAKVCVVDDTWASVGSDNFNRRSWSHDSELSCAVIDEDTDNGHASFRSAATPTTSYACQLRLTLAREHLDRADGDDADLRDPRATFDAFAATSAALERWYTSGRLTPRPVGRLRKYQTPQLTALTRAWATPLYRTVFDPDGRPRAMRRAGCF